MSEKINIFWFRRDLRLNDNHGLYEALKAGLPVLPVFIFDALILEKLSSKSDSRVTFIYNEIQKIKRDCEKYGSSLKVIYGKPLDVFEKLVSAFEIHSVFTNKDYEPFAIQRDNKIKTFLRGKGIEFKTFKDHVIFEENEVVKDNGLPYTVYTPYSKKWKQVFNTVEASEFPSVKYLDNLFKSEPFPSPKLKDIGFEKSFIQIPVLNVSEKIISNYEKTRNFPALEGTSKLGVHLRFGTISIRNITQMANELSEVYLNELIWRNFFNTILWHFPHVVEKAFKPKYDFIGWQNNEKEFEQWCRGETGYPLVDAGMHELNETGFMHNRVRMVTASFLVKHLLIDWRWGEAYFAEKLLDFELASNNGNWQWAAGCGCDAAPYFRIFNPEAQQKKFDPKKKYIMKWVPEFGSDTYAEPIVDHKFARERVLKVYKNALR